MKNSFTLFVLCMITLSHAQSYQVMYEKYYHDQLMTDELPIELFANASQTWVFPKAHQDSIVFPYTGFMVDQHQKVLNHITILRDHAKIGAQDTLFAQKYTYEKSDETKVILGYLCKKAHTVVNSNQIDIWYTTTIPGIMGSPTVLGQNLGLVLEINRNGNFIIRASHIEKVKEIPSQMTDRIEDIAFYNEITYKDLLWKSRFQTIRIFEDQTIHFSDQSVNHNPEVMRFAQGTVWVKKVKMPPLKKGTQIFAELKQYSQGDAYDRTGSVFIIPVRKDTTFLQALQKGIENIPVLPGLNDKKYQGVIATPHYEPLIEVMRFFTSFGIKQYNYLELKDKKWLEVNTYRQDISDLAHLIDNQEVYIGIFIGNYDARGHHVDLEITFHEDEVNQMLPTFIQPLFNTVNVMEMAGQDYATMFDNPNGLNVTFTLENDLKDARLRYITTGHGGWENGDEFLQKRNKIYVDGNLIFDFLPWRQDCGSYRLYNPASGNFENGLSSSDYSRSNWCPGTLTVPEYIFLGDLTKGIHTLQIKIQQGENEGNSFSSWNVSGVLMGWE